MVFKYNRANWQLTGDRIFSSFPRNVHGHYFAVRPFEKRYSSCWEWNAEWFLPPWTISVSSDLLYPSRMQSIITSSRKAIKSLILGIGRKSCRAILLSSSQVPESLTNVSFVGVQTIGAITRFEPSQWHSSTTFSHFPIFSILLFLCANGRLFNLLLGCFGQYLSVVFDYVYMSQMAIRYDFKYIQCPRKAIVVLFKVFRYTVILLSICWS